MINQINDGGAAFPNLELRHTCGDPIIEASTGMTLRDYFAGQALAGICFNMPPEYQDRRTPDEYAGDCYSMADAMLTARNQQQQQ